MTRLLGRRVISCSFAVVSRKLIEESPTSTATIGASVGKSLECTGRLLARGSCRHQFGRSADLTAGKTPQERQGRRKKYSPPRIVTKRAIDWPVDAVR